MSSARPMSGKSPRFPNGRGFTASAIVGILALNAASPLLATSGRGTVLQLTKARTHMLAPRGEREVHSSAGPQAAAEVPTPLKSATRAAVPISSAQGVLHARPLEGPVLLLTIKRKGESEELLDANTFDPPLDTLAQKVLTRGEAVLAPAGRADDFAWPHHDVAASDPVVVISDLPPTPIVAQKSSVPLAIEVGTEASQTGPERKPRRKRQQNYADNRQLRHGHRGLYPQPQQVLSFWTHSYR